MMPRQSRRPFIRTDSSGLTGGGAGWKRGAAVALRGGCFQVLVCALRTCEAHSSPPRVLAVCCSTAPAGGQRAHASGVGPMQACAAPQPPRKGDTCWCWYNEWGWARCTVMEVDAPPRSDPRSWLLSVRCEHKFGGGPDEDGVGPFGEDTVVFCVARPSEPPQSVLPGPPLPPFSEGEWRMRLNFGGVQFASAGAEQRALKPPLLTGGVDFAVAAIEGGGGALGLFALRQLRAGAAVTRYGGDVRSTIAYEKCKGYRGEDATFNRGAHLARTHRP